MSPESSARAAVRPVLFIPPPPVGATALNPLPACPPAVPEQGTSRPASSVASTWHPAPRTKVGGFTFEAEIECGELDDRGRPGAAWACRARQLSRSELVFMSRRMCYRDRRLIVAVHKIDSDPVPLLGRVATCDYESDGLYRVALELLPLPDDRFLRDWIEARARA